MLKSRESAWSSRYASAYDYTSVRRIGSAPVLRPSLSVKRMSVTPAIFASPTKSVPLLTTADAVLSNETCGIAVQTTALATISSA
jgi:hypothetical protein